MIWLAFPAFVFLTVRLAVVLVNLFSRQYLKDRPPESHPSVSVLIPARNEAGNLPGLLEGLLAQSYSPIEIWIYNDDSGDLTQEVIEAYAEQHSRIHYMKGEVLPGGWNGKNHACHQLSLKAKGEYLLFMDADVRVDKDLLSRSVAHALRYDLALLSIFPRQLMESFGEKITVPIMNWILISLLPLRLTRVSHYPSLAAANGQFMFFRGREYRHHRFHSLVRDINVEDIHIFRKMKRMGYTVHTVLSHGEISCRMYRNLREGIFGFTRSVFAFFGGSGLSLIFFTLLTTFGILFVWFGMGPLYGWIYLGLTILLRAFVALLSLQPVVVTTLLSPVIQITFVWIVIQSFILRSRGKNIWKGRVIQFRGI